MFTLRIAEHQHQPGIKLFEIWNKGKLMGAIYPTEKGIKLVSKYIADDPESAIKIDRSKLPSIPVILINLT